jgi:addiction module HigA family antidote
MLKRQMRNIHPGEILREEVLRANDLTVTETAKMLGVTRTTLSNIINGKSEISPEMCYRIAGVFGGTAEIWANLQTKYNLRAIADKVSKLKFKPYHPGARATA